MYLILYQSFYFRAQKYRYRDIETDTESKRDGGRDGRRRGRPDLSRVFLSSHSYEYHSASDFYSGMG